MEEKAKVNYSCVFNGGRHTTFVTTLHGCKEVQCRKILTVISSNAEMLYMKQEAGESVDSFVIALYGLVEH